MLALLLLACSSSAELAHCDARCEEAREACTDGDHACFCQEWAVCRVECDPGRGAPEDCEP